MSRLIDADELIEELRGSLFYSDSIPFVEDAPTAYNVEKVVAELEKGLKNLEHNKKLFEDNQAERGVFMCDSEITAFKMAIDIVKAGGINNDA